MTNEFTIEGEVCRPLETKQGENWKLTKVILSNVRTWEKNGEQKRKAYLFEFAFFGRDGEEVLAQVHPGDRIRVEGYLESEEKVSDRTGGTYFNLRAKAWNWVGLERASPETQPQQPPPQVPFDPTAVVIDGEETPF